MINNVLDSIVTAKDRLRERLDISDGFVSCVYRQGGRDIKGFIIEHKDSYDNDIYERHTMVIRVESHTGKRYSKYMSDLISVEGIEEL